MEKKLTKEEREKQDKKLTESERNKIKHGIVGTLKKTIYLSPEDFKKSIEITEREY